MNLIAFNRGRHYLRPPKKLLLIMKLTTFIMIIALAQVTAKGFGQKINLNVTNTPIEKVLQTIRQQSGYEFIYNANDLKGQKVTIQLNNASVEDAVEASLKNLDITYSIRENNIVLKRKAPSFLDRVVAAFTDIDPRGKILDQNGAALSGATVTVKGTSRAVITGKEGEFSFSDVPEDAVLIITYVGYKPLEISLKDAKMPLEIKLDMATGELKEVDITYNTGYQKLKPNEVTGSITHITKEQLNRSVSPNILNRLEGITQGVLFDRKSENYADGTPRIQIRGEFTLTTGNEVTKPLIVLDNFPFNGNINDIDPNNVESIDILKDAAAASIWGARAGNGVIVITTKKGAFNQQPLISVSSNIQLTKKPDIKKRQQISSSEYIDLESDLFSKGFYDFDINFRSNGLSPVVELLLKVRNGTLNETNARTQIDVYRNYDVRDDYLKYIYRQQVDQQYSIGVSGGGNHMSYALSGSFAGIHNVSSLKNNTSGRFTLNSNTSYKPLKWLNINLGVGFTSNNSKPNGMLPYGSPTEGLGSKQIYPYARFADSEGTPLLFEGVYRKSYTDGKSNGRLLNWDYYPLIDMELNDNNIKSNAFNISLGTEVRIFEGLSASLNYNLQKTLGIASKHYDKHTFFTRNLINIFTNLTPTTIKYGIPNEGILDLSNTSTIANNGRISTSYGRSWGESHNISVLAGADVSNVEAERHDHRTYGYSNHLSAGLVDYVTPVPTIYGSNQQIPSLQVFQATLNRTVAAFGNAAYIFRNRYTLSASVRKDAANILGLETNQKGSPFWSVGSKWDISRERFYKSEIVPELKLRMTYGYQGNYSPNGVARPIITYAEVNDTQNNLPYAGIIKFPNRKLRWERVGQFNTALDFGFKNNWINGSLGYWYKKSIDVIGQKDIDPTIGKPSQIFNSANIGGHGFDFNLNFRIIGTGSFAWTSNLNFAYVTYRITKYNGSSEIASNFRDVSGAREVGYSPYSIGSYRWVGLDPSNGNPLGYLNGEVSTDYVEIMSKANASDNIVMQGTTIAPYFGNTLNTFTFKGLSLSTNIIFNLGHKFRRPMLSYSAFQTQGYTYNEYSQRWQKPGDEKTTNVPSLIYPIDFNREIFYEYSEISVEKADHIMINDLQMSYILDGKVWKGLPFKSINVAVQMTGLNFFIWKASKYDPINLNGMPQPLAVAFKLNANF